MAGRPRLDIGTYGEITVAQVGPRLVRASTRFRDEDGRTRRVTVTGTSRNSATAALKRKLLDRRPVGDLGSALSSGSPFLDVAELWFESIRMDIELSQGTKEGYERESRSLLLPTFEAFTIREITVARVERFLKVQRTKSYARAKRSKTLLSLIMGFAVRHEVIDRNPVLATSHLRRPPTPPKALTPDEIARIRQAAIDWRAQKRGVRGPHPDGQVRDLIEVMLGTAVRIGEALALRKADVDLDASPATITIAGTIVTHKGKGAYRQPSAKTASSHRVIAIPEFVADVLRERLALIEGEGPDHLVFCTRRHTAIYPHNARRTFREILELAGLKGRDIHPHSFRKTGATLISAAAGDQAAARALGHSGVQITRDRYIERSAAANPATAAIMQGLAPHAGDREPATS